MVKIFFLVVKRKRKKIRIANKIWLTWEKLFLIYNNSEKRWVLDDGKSWVFKYIL